MFASSPLRFRLAQTLAILAACSLTGLQAAAIPPPGNPLAVGSVQLSGSLAGWDQVYYYANPSDTWDLKVKNWDPGYSPINGDDNGGNPVFSVMDFGTGSNTGTLDNFPTKSTIKAYYNNPQSPVAYTYWIEHWVNGAFGYRYGNLASYSMP